MNFKQFNTSDNQWYDVPYYQHKTATDTLTLPAVIYPNDTSITVGIKGNTTQSGTPSPQNPVVISGTGDLETTGEHAGQYKIPILSNSTTTNVYLGEVQSTRKIKKLVLTGEESEIGVGVVSGVSRARIRIRSNYGLASTRDDTVFSHYVNSRTTSDGNATCETSGENIIAFLICDNAHATSETAFREYLAQQYAVGTPVTIWYVLATETTGIVNEPIRRIGNYADEVSGITIPTIAGANTISIGTTLQPSEVSVNYHGWHPVLAVHERENGAWD